jgi:hypothetical protein
MILKRIALTILLVVLSAGVCQGQVIVTPVAGVATVDVSTCGQGGANPNPTCAFKLTLAANASLVINNATNGATLKLFINPSTFALTWPATVATPTPTLTASQNNSIILQYDGAAALWYSIGGSGGGISSATGVYLSPNCAAGSITPPCINIPPSGGCYEGGGVITASNSPTISFVSGFPTNPPPQVGQEAWVMQLNAGVAPTLSNFCGTGYNNTLEGNNFTAQINCGKTLAGGGTPITITAINPGVSITVSQNCAVTQGGSNTVLFYGPNIYSQLVTACSNIVSGVALGQTSVHVAQGFYVLDNTGTSSQSSCGCVHIAGCSPNTYTFANLSGEGEFSTGLYTPPWYDHTGDLGTVLAGGIIHDLHFDGTWTNLGLAHGTVYDGPSCGSHDFAILGYNLAGASGVSESMYPNTTLAPTNGSCEMHNAHIVSGDSGLEIGGGQATHMNSVIITRNPTFLDTNNGVMNGFPFRIIGGHYQSQGRNRNGGNAGVIALPADSSTASNDKLIIQNADLAVCNNASNVAAVTDTEPAGELQLSNVRINQQCANSGFGTNTSGITIASGITLSLYKTQIGATGTGNTINNPTGGTVLDNCGNTASGGAGYTGTGAYGGPCYTLGPSPAASNITLGAGYGTSSVATFVTSPVDSRRHFTFTLTLAGSLTLATETITYTFPVPFDVAPGTCRATPVGGTQFAAAAYSFLTTTAPTTTSVGFTQQTAAGTAGNTEIIAIDCG